MNIYDFWKHIGDVDDELIYEVNVNQKSYRFKKRATICGVSIAACIVLILFGIVFIPFNSNNNTSSQSGLVIKACASQIDDLDNDILILSNTKARLSSNQDPDNHDIHIEHFNSEFGKIPGARGIWFSFSGDNISSVDFNCTQGESFIYLDDIEFLAFTDDIKALTLNHYIAHGQTVKGIECEKGKYINLYWLCDKYDDERLNYILQHGYSEEQYYDKEDSEMIALIKEYNESHLNDSDEITEYYGGTLYLTVHYNNGISETVEIEVSVDYEYNGGKHGFGDYVLSYK